MSKRVLFLDYDDVVNKAMWKKKSDETYCCTYNFPSDGKVNDEQAVQWVSEFCEKFGYSIVVSSSWRIHSNYKECLMDAGLRDGICIDGKTPECLNESRGYEISMYLKEHPEIEEYIILDDMGSHYFIGHEDHLVQIISGSFGINEFIAACETHKKLYPEYFNERE